MVRVKVSTLPQQDQDVRAALEPQLFQRFTEDVVFLPWIFFLKYPKSSQTSS